MKLNPESKTISEIFPIEPRSSYRIPIYQRNYSWETQNIEEFFNDVQNEEEGYYIGNLLVTEANKESGVVFDVVDGQQRLTTIALFLLAIYDRLSELRSDGNAVDLDNIIQLQGDLKRKLLINNSIPHIELLDKDKEIFENYLGSLRGEPRGKYGNRIFGKRYKYIQDLMTNEFHSYEDVNKFYHKLNAIELLRITVENISDAFSVFSSLNAKGLPLTLIDLLKSTYLGKATQEGIYEEEAIGKWDELIDIFSDENSEPNSGAITQFFLNNYDTFITESTSSITKKSALKKYQKLFNNLGYIYIDELIENAKSFSIISPLIENHVENKLTHDTNNTIKKLMRLESSQAYPLQMFLLKQYIHNKINESIVSEIFNYLVNFYVRRNLVLKPKSSNIRSKILHTVRLLNDEKNINNNAVRIVKDSLNSISSSEQDFRLALSGSVYDVSPQTVRVIFIDLEREYGKLFSKQNPDNLDDYNNNKSFIWTLEHILPKTENLKHGWDAMISPHDIDDSKQIQQKNMHKIGNMTLTGYNSEMSDRSFLAKKDYTTNNGYTYDGLRTKLFLNESIPGPGENIEDKLEWTIEDIERRTEYFSNLIVEKYNLN